MMPQAIADRLGIPFFETSAKSNTNITETIEEVARLCLADNFIRRPVLMPTDRLEALVVLMNQRHPGMSMVSPLSPWVFVESALL